jgi:hypothetical protein
MVRLLCRLGLHFPTEVVANGATTGKRMCLSCGAYRLAVRYPDTGRVVEARGWRGGL